MPHETYRERGFHWGTWLLVALIFVLGLVVLVLGVTTRAVNRALDGKASLDQAKVHLFALQLDVTVDDLRQAGEAFEASHQAFLWLEPLRLFSFAGDQLEALQAVTHSAQVGSLAVAEVLETVTDTLVLAGEDEALFSESNVSGTLIQRWTALDEDTRRAILQRLSRASDPLLVSASELDVTRAELEETSTSRLIAPVASLHEQAREGLLMIEDVVRTSSELVTVLPTLLGADGESQILLLFLNDQELRPGGGFLGSFGVLSTDAGLVKSLITDDILAIDNPATGVRTTPPPAPIVEYMDVETWFARDANWSPDFTESAKTVSAFFAEETLQGGERALLSPPVEFDAVVGLTTRVVSDLLQVIGSITVDGQTFDAENIAEALESEVEFGFVDKGISREDRKAIIGTLANEMIRRIQGLSAGEYVQVLRGLESRVQDKNLMAYSVHPSVEALFEKAGWSGRVPEPFAGDYLQVVDANLAALKTDPVMKRAITYRVNQEASGDLIATVTMHYEHTQPFRTNITRYRTFTRFYVPKGSELIETQGSLANDKLKNPQGLPDEVVVGEELGKTVFGMFTSIEPETERDLVVSYRLPKDLSRSLIKKGYQLMVQKQLGAQNHALTVDLHFDTTVTRAVPAEDVSAWGDTAYQLNTILDQDRTFEVGF